MLQSLYPANMSRFLAIAALNPRAQRPSRCRSGASLPLCSAFRPLTRTCYTGEALPDGSKRLRINGAILDRGPLPCPISQSLRSYPHPGQQVYATPESSSTTHTPQPSRPSSANSQPAEAPEKLEARLAGLNWEDVQACVTLFTLARPDNLAGDVRLIADHSPRVRTGFPRWGSRQNRSSTS